MIRRPLLQSPALSGPQENEDLPYEGEYQLVPTYSEDGEKLPLGAKGNGELIPTAPRQNQVIDAYVDEATLDRAIAARASMPLNNPLIHEITYEFRKNRGLVRASGVLTRVQRKVMNLLAWHALPEIGMRTLHEISIKDLEMLLHSGEEAGGSNRKILLDALRELKSIELNLYYDSQGREDDVTSTGILSDFQYKRSDGKLIYGFNQITAALLCDAAFAAQLDIRTVSKMKSRYSLALLEIACSYLSEGATPMFAVDVWRRDLDVLDDPTYAEFRYFNAKIIKPAINEILEIAKIELKMEKKNIGPKVVAFRFVITRASNAELGTVDAIAVKNSPIFKRLRVIGVTPALAIQAILRDPVHATDVADKTETDFREGKIKNPSGWAAKMLREYLPVKSQLERDVEAELKKPTKSKSKTKDVTELSGPQLKKQITIERKKQSDLIVTEYLNSLTPSEVFEKAKHTLTTFSPPTYRAELSERLRDGALEDGTIKPDTLQWLIHNTMFRGYLYNQADPGCRRVNAVLNTKFGPAAMRKLDQGALDL